MLDKLKQDLKKAQLKRDELKVLTLRLLLSEIHNTQITLRRGSGQEKELSLGDIISVIQKEVKKRKEAAVGFRGGGREDAALKEEAEAKVLEEYLPTQVTNEELTEIVQRAITEVGAPSDIGKVMGVVMGKVSGRADGGRVSDLVKAVLSK